MKTLTKELQKNLTPRSVYELLTEGNKRFVDADTTDRNLNKQVQETSDGQFPSAVILSCIDSRVPVKLIFDQGIGDLFSVRVAGNIVNNDVLGSIEYGCKVAGSKLVLVLGHTKCGAVNAACQNVMLGNITSLLEKIKPAVKMVDIGSGEMEEKSTERVAIYNVENSIKKN